jgi:hypothetical protein
VSPTQVSDFPPVLAHFAIPSELLSKTDAILPAGLDYSNCFFHDPNTEVPVCMDTGTRHNCKKRNGHRKIVSYRYLADTFAGYAADVTFGHGTHVAGTIAGNIMSPVASEEEYARKYNGCVITHTYAMYASACQRHCLGDLLPCVQHTLHGV